MAKINLEAINGYADMTVEEKLAALEAFEYDDHSTEVEKMKNAVSKANGEAAEWRRKHNALLSEDEQKKQSEAQELETLKGELANLRKEKTVSDYKSQLLALGYSEKLANSTAVSMADGDMAAVFASQKAFNESYKKSLEATLLANANSGNAGGLEGSGGVTQEQFNAMGYTDRAKLFAENQDLYNRLNGGN